jgi:hypothetical protein
MKLHNFSAMLEAEIQKCDGNVLAAKFQGIGKWQSMSIKGGFCQLFPRK